MPPRKRYKGYLRDVGVDVPTRTKHRYKQKAQHSEACESQQTLHSDASTDDQSDVDVPDVSDQQQRNDSSSVPPRESNEVNVVRHESVSDDGGDAVSSTDASSSSDESDSDEDFRGLNCTASSSDASSVCSDSSDDSSDEPSEVQDIDSQEPYNAQRAEMDEYLYPGCRITRGESLLLLMAHSLRHHSSREATESLLKLVQAHLPDGTRFPSSKYLFFKQFTDEKEQPEMFFYCKISKCLLGKAEAPATEIHCPGCDDAHCVKELREDGSYFLVLSIETQVRKILENPESHIVLTQRKRSMDVSDITDSKAYNELGLGQDDISVSWNTDGVPLYESSKCSIWPIQLQINELPLKERVKKVVLAGLWFGGKKPEMDVFLKPFVDEMNHLSSNGFSWTSTDGTRKHTRVFPGPCVVDTVARCEVMGMTQYNGAHGCAWCKQEGKVVKKGKGSTRVYPVESVKDKMRTDASMRQYASEAEHEGEPVMGMTRSTVIFFLAFFKFPAGFAVDYMHAVCSGFVRATARMWFRHKRAFPYSLGLSIPTVDARLNRLRLVQEMPRLPRSVDLMKYWKSSEWRNWLLYLSPVVLHGVLNVVYYQNWMKFVRIMHILLGDSVASDQLRSLQKDMFSFLQEYEGLYGEGRITFNAHALLHLVDCVREWGPLWNVSAYSYEGVNGRLVRLVNGTRHAHLQIAEKFLILSAMPKLCAERLTASSPVRSLLVSMTKGYRLRVHCTVASSYTLLGKGKQTAYGVEYSKVIVNGLMYCVERLDKSRRANSYVQIATSTPHFFGQIKSIVHEDCQGHSHNCNCGGIVFFIVNKLKVQHRVFSETFLNAKIIFLVQPSSSVLKVDATEVQKCVALSVDEKLFLSPVQASHIREVV